MKTLPLLMVFFLPAWACDSCDVATKAEPKSAPALHATIAPAKPAAPRAKPPRREISTPRPAYLFM